MTIYCKYFDNQEKSFDTFNEIDNYDNIIELKACFQDISDFPDVLPIKLEYLLCSNNNISKLPLLPKTLKYIDCSYNKLTLLPLLPSNLQELYCNNNQLTQLPLLPVHIKKIYIHDNLITKLSDNFIECLYINNIYYFNNPVELTIQQENLIEMIDERNQNRFIDNGHYMNDKQNIHNSSIQSSIRQSIINLLNN